MSVSLEVRSPGALTTVQDMGRRGYRRLGVPWAGVLDARLMRVANRLAGNADDAPVLECFDGGQQFVAHTGPVRLAVAGDCEVELLGPAGAQKRTPWRSITLIPGETLRVLRTQGRFVVVAVAGLHVTPVLGSCATYARAGLGGLNGRALQPGDHLAADAASGHDHTLPVSHRARTLDDGSPIRIVPGPQADHFTPTALDALLAAEFRVTAEADRMGMRLAGPLLAHEPSRGTEILSDATVPGSIQVPGNGQPIVLLADGQTAGGYPKIATVCSADLPRLAARRPGQAVRFAAATVAEAEALARAAEATTRGTLAAIAPLADDGQIDLTALYAANLVGGVVDALGR